MVSRSGEWGPDPEEFVKRVPDRQPQVREEAGSAVAARQLEATGVTWAHVDASAIEESAVTRSRQRFRAHLPDLVWNTAALEGNTFTLPEVRTLLDGVTVGGKRIEEHRQIVSLSEAYNRLDELVARGEFALHKDISDELHALVSRHEALDPGRFRGEGDARGGGNVRLASGGMVAGTDHGEGGALLRRHFDALVAYLESLVDPRERALVYFASAIRRQFYFDGNKRTARLMMTGELMASGFDMVSIPFARKLEFNIALDELFTTDDASALLRFLVSCSIA